METSCHEVARIAQYSEDHHVISLFPILNHRLDEVLAADCTTDPSTTAFLRAEFPHDLEMKIEHFGAIQAQEGTIEDVGFVVFSLVPHTTREVLAIAVANSRWVAVMGSCGIHPASSALP